MSEPQPTAAKPDAADAASDSDDDGALSMTLVDSMRSGDDPKRTSASSQNTTDAADAVPETENIPQDTSDANVKNNEEEANNASTGGGDVAPSDSDTGGFVTAQEDENNASSKEKKSSDNGEDGSAMDKKDDAMDLDDTMEKNEEEAPAPAKEEDTVAKEAAQSMADLAGQPSSEKKAASADAGDNVEMKDAPTDDLELKDAPTGDVELKDAPTGDVELKDAPTASASDPEKPEAGKEKVSESQGDGAKDADEGAISTSVDGTDQNAVPQKETETMDQNGESKMKKDISATTAPADGAMEDSDIRKSMRTKTPSIKLRDIEDATKEPSIDKTPPKSTPPADSNSILSPPKTPQELYERIKKSRDKLFFIAYSHTQDPKVNKTTKEQRDGNAKPDYQWYLARVDLSTCQELDDAQDCQNNGKYYVEFYTKASYDQGILLRGHPLENGVPAAKMKPKKDSESRYWLEWHEYHFDKQGEMIVGKAKEFLPNGQTAIRRRLMDLCERKRNSQKEGSSSPSGSASDGSGSGSDGEERLMSEYHPDFDRYTTWADVMDLMDDKTRLVGPFDFEDTKPPPLTDEELAMYNKETRKIFMEHHSDLYIKDRVHISKWYELVEVLRGRNDIEPPSIAVENPKKKSRLSGNKRGWSPMGTSASALLSFPATSSRPSVDIHHPSFGPPSTKKKHAASKTPVSKGKLKEEILSVIDTTLYRTRHANSSVDGEVYYLFQEVKDALKKAFGNWTIETPTTDDGGKKDDEKDNDDDDDDDSGEVKKSHEPIQGLDEEKFSKKEVDTFPVVFAYNNDDPSGVSEENAKIATLDYEVEQRRLRRRSSEGGGVGGSKSTTTARRASKPSTSKPSTPKSSPRSRVATDKDFEKAAEPAEGFPKGWMMRRFKRSGGSRHEDRYYYSPKMKYKFRSRPEVTRFLAVLKRSGGNEAAAIEKFRG